jgi:NADP-dependent aldehyde dehydrogenase
MSDTALEIGGTSLVAGRRVQPTGDASLFTPFEPVGFESVQSHEAAARRGVDRFFAATADDVDAAAKSAGEAFEVFAARSREERAALLEAIAAGLSALGPRLVEIVARETSLAGERIEAERDRTVRQLQRFAALVREGAWVEAVIDHGDQKRLPAKRPDLRRMLRPLGPVAVFGASNFPLAYSTAGGDTASALAAGCPVVVKGHPAHPGTGELVAAVVSDAVRRLALPPGTFSFLHAGGTRELEVGKELVRHPAIRAGGFTGSFAGGIALARIAAERRQPIPFFAEMGSVNPVVVLPGALAHDPAGRAQMLFASFTSSVGQMCTCPGLVLYVRDAAGYLFVRELDRLVQASRGGVMLTPRIRASFEQRIESLGRIDGVRVATTGGPRDAHLVAPVILHTTLSRFLLAHELAEECFGPSTLLVACEDAKELERAAEHLPGSLTATLWAASDERALSRRVLAKLARIAGRVIHGGVPTGVEVAAAMVHGGPFPATTRPESTAVGPFAIRRWCRPVCYQDCPEELLPPELEEHNPLGIVRLVDGRLER